MKAKFSSVIAICLASCAGAGSDEPLQQPESSATSSWRPVEGRLMTRWGRAVTPENAWREYPRPTMVRERWQNLNGLWQYAITGGQAQEPTAWDGEILVPYPIESALSGVGKRLAADQTLWYRRTFEIPSEWRGDRVLLHFGAVDWSALVSVNGRDIGAHTGGYDGFELDITDALREGANELVVAVTDPSDSGSQPRGKQVTKPEGIWYTPSSGIWQTVWMEPVPESRIRALRVSTRGGRLLVDVDVAGTRGDGVTVTLLDNGRSVASVGNAGFGAELQVESPKLWSPSEPHLYELAVTLELANVGVLDTAKSYVAFRDIELAPDDRGVQRLLLNGRPLFQFGPLDQGFWPDGLYTPPSVAAMRFDIEAVKQMGGNMLRKHVKVEPALFYTLCDQLGVLVWQDMPSGDFERPGGAENFEREVRELIRGRGHHPSIVMWVPFNEGWGQHDTERITELVRKLDPTRFVNNASGWTDKRVGDVIDIHAYPGPAMAPVEAYRASVLGEFGGLGLPLEGHTWLAQDNWGYRSFTSQEALTDAYVQLLEQMPLLVGQGLCAAVYTQTTDVEIEVNGWLTYDRDVWKIDPDRARAAARKLYEPPPKLRELVRHAGNGAAGEWNFTFEAPGVGWHLEGFDASVWKRGASGFGTAGTPGAVVGTEWSSSEIWLRCEFELESAPTGDVRLWLHHDEDAEVYLNGVLAADVDGYTTSYALLPIAPAARATLAAGRNLLAIHCKQTTGGQYIDAGLCAAE